MSCEVEGRTVRLIKIPLVARSKKPLVFHWSSLEPDSSIWGVVSAAVPDCNWGLRLDDLVVLDADSLRAVDFVVRNAPMVTRYVSAGRPDRAAFWYARPEDCELRTCRLAPDLELRTGSGAQQVIPPSRHPEGHRYTWIGPAGELTDDSELPLAPVEWIASLVPEHDPWGEGEGGWDFIPEGHRDDALTSMGGLLRRHGASVRAVEQALGALNELLCLPPLALKDVVRVARSVGRYEPDVTIEFDDDGLSAAEWRLLRELGDLP